jgi:hypothetical protein
MINLVAISVLLPEIDEEELAVRLIESQIGYKRPPDLDAKQLIAKTREAWESVDAGPYPFLDLAKVAIAYCGECLTKASPAVVGGEAVQ